jgi:predicted phage baseplate assembly protein
MPHKPPANPCGGRDLAPRRPDNRPGLPRIDYRIGTYPEFFDRLKWRLPRQTVIDPETNALLHPLASLRARTTDDPTIALFDGFAATLDVLSFYSEQIANEGYLGTASQRRSLVELGRMIGYEPNPGVAASVDLSFTVEAADDPYRAVEVPIGVQAMSVPTRKGELPQVFETVVPITARAEWNAMPARTLHDQPLALYQNSANASDPDNGRLFLFDLDNSFDDPAIADPAIRSFSDAASLARYFPLSEATNLLDALAGLISAHALNPEVEPLLRALPLDEIYLKGTGLGLRPGQRIVVVGVLIAADDTRSIASSTLRVVSAADDRDFGVTRLVATQGGGTPDSVSRAPGRRSPRLKLLRMPTERLSFDSVTIDSVVRQAQWSGPALSALVRSQSWSRVKLMHLIRRPRHVDAPQTTEAQPGLFLLRDDCGFFGCNAPRFESLGKNHAPYTNGWDDTLDRTIWTNSQGLDLPGNVHLFLEREVKEIVPDGWTAIETADGEAMVFRVAAAATRSRVDYAITGKSTGLTLRQPDGSDLVIPAPGDASPLNDFRFRTARIFAVSAALPIAGTPIREDVDAGADAIDLDALYLDLVSGQTVSIGGERSDADGLSASETLTVSDVVHIGGHTRLLLESGPEFSYRRPSVTINANMARATHGEFYREQLGSGDAAQEFQRFKLGKAPLTYVAAETPSGTASSLEIRIDGLLWHEVASLYTAGPEDRVYEVRHEDDGTTWVQFGDGLKGRRLPTGQLNTIAAYRTGIGVAGEVADEAIIQFKTRPLGIRSVVNPSRASGSAGPETLAEIRTAAPRDVKTLGRIVSLIDYRDFAGNYTGVGKAAVARLWSGQRQIVHLSICGTTDAILEDDAPIIGNLQAAADKVRDVSTELIVAAAARRYFQLVARLYIGTDYLAADVEAAARAALLVGFGFSARAIGQAVSAAEVMALLQAVTGVVGVDLDSLELIEGAVELPPPPTTLASVLPAQPAQALPPGSAKDFAPAELLTLLESGIVLTTETAHA